MEYTGISGRKAQTHPEDVIDGARALMALYAVRNQRVITQSLTVPATWQTTSAKSTLEKVGVTSSTTSSSVPKPKSSSAEARFSNTTPQLTLPAHQPEPVAETSGERCNGKYRALFTWGSKKHSSKGSLERHLRSHADERPFKGEHSNCGRGFAHQSTKIKHMHTPTCEETYKCQYKDCKITFSAQRSKIRHERVHADGKPFTCKICPYKTNRNNNLTNHIRTRHPTQAKEVGITVFKCEACDHYSSSGRDLKIHMRIHTGERPFKCEYSNCGKKFSQPSSLKIHLRNHTGERPYKCRYCVEAFAISSLKIRHERAHTHEKPFKCEYPNCGKAFSEQRVKIIHGFTHFDARNYKCLQQGCTSTFKQPQGLARHMKSHALKCVRCTQARRFTS